jgi:hypothetical protein
LRITGSESEAGVGTGPGGKGGGREGGRGGGKPEGSYPASPATILGRRRPDHQKWGVKRPWCTGPPALPAWHALNC